MGREDWYRNTQWNEEIEAAFRERLNRSRQLFQKAALRLDGVNHNPVLPHEYYELGLSSALLHDAMGLFDAAKASATIALIALETDSPFKRGEKVYGKAFAIECLKDKPALETKTQEYD